MLLIQSNDGDDLTGRNRKKINVTRETPEKAEQKVKNQENSWKKNKDSREKEKKQKPKKN